MSVVTDDGQTDPTNQMTRFNEVKIALGNLLEVGKPNEVMDHRFRDVQFMEQHLDNHRWAVLKLQEAFEILQAAECDPADKWRTKRNNFLQSMENEQ